MSVSTSTAAGRYVYAFCRARDADLILATQMRGMHDAELESNVFGDVAAITTPIEGTAIRPRRAMLAAHQNVVSEISRRWDMLPVSFGLVASDAEELESLVSANSGQLLKVLDRVSGAVEMNLVVSLSGDDPYQYFVAQSNDLKTARDRIAEGEASRDQMIEMGRLFESVMNRERETHRSRVVKGLAEVCREVDPQDPKNEKELVRVNCLVARDAEQAFEAAIYQLASSYNEDFAFSFNGPWPPYSFVDLKLSME